MVGAISTVNKYIVTAISNEIKIWSPGPKSVKHLYNFAKDCFKHLSDKHEHIDIKKYCFAIHGNITIITNLATVSIYDLLYKVL